MQGRICGSRRNRAFSSSMLRSVVVRWRSRVGQARRDGPTRPITTCDRGRGLCAPASQRNSRLRDLCCPIRWQLRLRRDAPLSRAELLRLCCLIHCSRRCGWLCSRLASPNPHPALTRHPCHLDTTQSNESAWQDEFAHCRSSPRKKPPTRRQRCQTSDSLQRSAATSTPAVSAKAAFCVVEPQNISSSCHRLSRPFGRRRR